MPQPAPDDLRRLISSGGLSRRGFLRGAGLAGLGLGVPGLLSGCGTEGAKQSAKSCVSKDLSASQKTLKFSNWPLYIDEAKVKRGGKKVTIFPSLEKFQKDSGIKVDYVADVNDNSEFFGIVRNQLADCQPTGRDIFVLTDYMPPAPSTWAGSRSSTRTRSPTSPPTSTTACAARPGTRTASTPSRGRAASPASPTTPSSRGRCAASRSC
jgi:hypothetical protein